MADTEYREKIRSLGFSTKRGQSERKRVVDERDGSTAGIHDVHWDGSQDAAARPKPIRVRARLLNEEDR
jgi:formylmethanofuran dehydrogenase subunit B